MTVDERDVAAVVDCLRSGWLTMGPRIRELESLLAERLGIAEVVVVSSGTAAIQLACTVAGVKPGESVGLGADASPWAGAAIQAAGGGLHARAPPSHHFLDHGGVLVLHADQRVGIAHHAAGLGQHGRNLALAAADAANQADDGMSRPFLVHARDQSTSPPQPASTRMATPKRS